MEMDGNIIIQKNHIILWQNLNAIAKKKIYINPFLEVIVQVIILIIIIICVFHLKIDFKY